MKAFFDSNAFDFFYNRRMDPYNDLIAAGFRLCVTPGVRSEILEKSKPEEIKKIYIDLEKQEKIKSCPMFGMITYQNIQENNIPIGITGYSSYEDYDSKMGSCLTFEKMLLDKNPKKEEREAYLNKSSQKPKKLVDRILSSHSIHSIILSCDTDDALGVAYDYGYKIVFLGNANPLQPRPINRPCFDDYDGDLINYVGEQLEAQRVKLTERMPP